jgi:ribose/xylose/arabinose/galactoside ABC-type transport system permease subunit
MNPRAFDLITRSVTSSFLAIGVLLLAAYQVVHSGEVDTSVGSFVGLVLGFFFGAHVSQNGASARSRAEQIIVAETLGQEVPADSLSRLRPPKPDGG